jgi:hypothetical protein
MSAASLGQHHGSGSALQKQIPVYGFMLIPYLAQTEDNFRELLCRRAAACGHDPGQE